LLSFDLLLISLDLLILPVVFIFLTLELVTDKRTGTKSEAAANRGTHTRAPDSSADETTRRCTTQSTDSSSFLPGC
jgi:hypothetical protein